MFTINSVRNLGKASPKLDRMNESGSLAEQTTDAGLKNLFDFVPTENNAIPYGKDKVSLTKQEVEDIQSKIRTGEMREARKMLDAKVAMAENINQIQVNVARSTPTALPPDAPLVTETGAIRPETLTEGDMKKIDTLVSPSHPLVSKNDLKLALTKAAKYPGGIDGVYERIVGEKGTDALKFQTALTNQLTLLQNLGGGDRGLEAVLSGTIPSYLIEANKNNKLPRSSRANPETLMSPGFENTASLVATLGIGVVSGGIVTFTNQTERLNAEKFIQEYKAYEKANTAEKWWTSLKETISGAVSGKKLAFQFLKNESEGNVQKYLDDIWKYMDAVFNPNNPENKKIMTLATSYGYNPMAVTPERYLAFQRALVETYIQTEGFKRQGVDFSASLGLIFIGGRNEEIMTGAVTPGRVDSSFASIGAERVSKSLDFSSLNNTEIKYDPTTKQWVHTFPSKMTVNGKSQPTSVVGQIATDGKYPFPDVMDMKVSDVGGKYIITPTKRPNQPAIPTESVPSIPVKQDQSEAQRIRDNTERSGLAEKLAFIGHSDPKTFGSLLTALSKQDDAGVNAALIALQKTKYKTLATQLLADIANSATWTTYMYGTKNGKNMETVDGTRFTRERKVDVLKAEEKILKGLGITTFTSEESFQPINKDVPSQASTRAPGQEMTSMVLATPKGGLHRADTMDGSIATMSTKLELQGESRSQVVDAMAKSVVDGKGIDVQWKKFNTFLTENGQSTITKDKYIQYLKDQNTDALGVTGLKVRLGAKVFESRAMIAGNACCNRSFHIGYPVFEISKNESKPVTQSVIPAGSIDSVIQTAPVGQVGNTQIRETAGGVNPIILGARTIIETTKPSTSTPTNGNSTSTPTNTGVGTPGTTPAGNTGRVPTAPTVTVHPIATQTVVTEQATNSAFSIGTGVFGSLDQMSRMVPRASQKTEKKDNTVSEKNTKE